MNVLSQDKVDAIVAALNEGRSLRGVALSLRVGKGTVARYRHLATAQQCKCGRAIKHRGACIARLKQHDHSLRERVKFDGRDWLIV